MIHDIKKAVDAVVAAAEQQSQRLLSEIGAVNNDLNAARAVFNLAMEKVAAMRAEADKMQAAAIRAFDTAQQDAAAVLIGLSQQIDAGEIVTHSERPAHRIGNGMGAH